MSEYGKLKAAVAGLDNQTDVMACFLSVLGANLEKSGKECPILVGGSALEFYTQGSYMSRDIDIFSSREETFAILEKMGFVRKGRMFYSEEFDILVDWCGTVLGEGSDAHERALDINMEDLGKFRVVSPMDLIVDRLQAYEFWKDRASGEWAKILIDLGRSGKIRYDGNTLKKCILATDLSPDILEKLERDFSWNPSDGEEDDDSEDDDGGLGPWSK